MAVSLLQPDELPDRQVEVAVAGFWNHSVVFWPGTPFDFGVDGAGGIGGGARRSPLVFSMCRAGNSRLPPWGDQRFIETVVALPHLVQDIEGLDARAQVEGFSPQCRFRSAGRPYSGCGRLASCVLRAMALICPWSGADRDQPGGESAGKAAQAEGELKVEVERHWATGVMANFPAAQKADPRRESGGKLVTAAHQRSSIIASMWKFSAAALPAWESMISGFLQLAPGKTDRPAVLPGYC